MELAAAAAGPVAGFAASGGFAAVGGGGCGLVPAAAAVAERKPRAASIMAWRSSALKWRPVCARGVTENITGKKWKVLYLAGLCRCKYGIESDLNTAAA
jgi:hypothetical protein